MNLNAIQLKDNTGKVVDAAEAVCDVCHGNSFHIVVVNSHNHLICSNPICGESYCQGQGECSFTTVKPKDEGACPCGEDH